MSELPGARFAAGGESHIRFAALCAQNFADANVEPAERADGPRCFHHSVRGTC
jgi:hypothetical protein